MGFLVACKNDEDPIKNEGAIMVTTFFIDFSDVQGQRSQCWNLAEVLTHPSFYSWSCYLQK